MPSSTRTPPRSSQGLALRAGLRALEELRLKLVRALRQSALPLDEAITTADAWLLAGLAAEELGAGSAMDALTAAADWTFPPIVRLTREVSRLTGLPIEVPVRVGGLATGSPQRALPFRFFAALRDQEDPFGTLGQLLRAARIVENDGVLSIEESERRRDEGGYYTPYRSARRLVERALDGFEDVPAVIDPACGAGTFLAAAFDVLWERLEERRREHPADPIQPVAWAVAALHGVELDQTALLAAKLSLAVRAVKAERTTGRAGQLALFGQAATYGPLISDRLRLGDALAQAPADLSPGTDRLRLRLLARDEPGRLPVHTAAQAVQWDAEFPLRFADEEGAFKPDHGFDLVITNPPFVPVDRIAPERRKQLMEQLSTAQRRFDLFIGFVERALTLLTPGGRATLLIPRTFLSEANAEKCRALLLERATIERIEELGPIAFEGAKVECIALTFVLRKAGDHAPVQIVRRGARKPLEVPHGVYRRAPRVMLRLELAEPAAAECVRLAELSVPLGKYLCASWGARGTPVKDFHLDAPQGPLSMPMVKGDDVTPFRLRPSTRWLLYDTEKLYRPSRREFFEEPKLLVKKVTAARGLVCAVDTGGHYTDDSLACVVRKADLASIPVSERKRHRIRIAPSQIEPSRQYDLHLVCALLQTPLVQTYYRVQLGGGLNVFPELIEALPLPKPEQVTRPEATELIELARAAARGEAFDEKEADRLARILYGL